MASIVVFDLSIDLGNDAMKTPRDVAGALLRVAQDLMEKAPQTDRKNALYDVFGKIKDENGNSVGKWKFLEAEGGPDEDCDDAQASKRSGRA